MMNFTVRTGRYRQAMKRAQAAIERIGKRATPKIVAVAAEREQDRRDAERQLLALRRRKAVQDG